MMHDQGEVWWGPAPQKDAPSYRPWVIVSKDSHPFAQSECICLGMTTQQHSEGIEVTTSDWRRGGAQTTSFISPWYVATIKYRDLDRQQGELPESIVEAAVEDLHKYTTVA